MVVGSREVSGWEEEVHQNGVGMQTLHILPWLCKQRCLNIHHRLLHRRLEAHEQLSPI